MTSKIGSQNSDIFHGREPANILGVPVSTLELGSLLEVVHLWSRQSTHRIITYVNAHCLNLAQRYPHYLLLLQQADLVYSDGVSVVWASKMLGGNQLQKMTGGDWIHIFCKMAVRDSLRMYILGGYPGIVQRARLNLENKYPGIKIVGTSDGYFQEKSEQEVLSEIEATQPHVVFVGMGTPRQEEWIFSHRSKISAPVCWAVGALFDLVAGSERRVPAWMNSLGLEWFWRLLLDPRGKWKRYLIGNPVFVARVLRQTLAERLSTRKFRE